MDSFSRRCELLYASRRAGSRPRKAQNPRAKINAMTRRDTLQTISKLLPEQPQEKLEALLGWLQQGDDAFEQRLRADVEAGAFDRIIADVIAQDKAGETTDIECP